MILHYSPKSPFVRKVMVFIHETGLYDKIDRERSVTNMLVPNHKLMEFNPWSKIPTLVLDDGRVLFDSDVICEYLDTVHDGPPLIPTQADERFQALRWRSFGNEMLHCLILWRNERERPPEKILDPAIEAFTLKLHTGLAMLETETAQLESAAFSVGHIALGCALGYIDFRFNTIPWRDQYPQVAAWFADFEGRESARLTNPIDDIPHVKATDL
jgi:glutathione S-transferase